MVRFRIVIVALLGLAACAAPAVPTAPVSAAPIRAFGAHIAAEHTRINTALLSVARRLNLVPYATGADLSGLAGLPDPEFDRQFIADQVKNHREALALFQAGAQSVQNPRLRQFAREWLAVLRRDLGRAERVAAQFGV